MKGILGLLAIVCAVRGLDNGLGLTPPMGFNTWNHFACKINEKVIKGAADNMVKLGLKEVGYIYVNIDDCWMAPKRGENDELVPDPERFPNGIKSLADYVHGLGMKLGIYSSAGAKTCEKLPASQYYEEIDARTWASWGIDYLKYDNCNHDGTPAIVRYTRMRDALNQTGRPIYYSICNWGLDEIWEWGKYAGNSWRTTGDIKDNFNSVREIYRRNVVLEYFGGPGGWNDPDMLEVGNGKMTTEEYVTHFTLWAMAKSPMLIGCDLTAVKPEDLEILKNTEIIALSQDTLGQQARCALHCTSQDFSKDSTNPQVTLGALEDGQYALAVTNWNDKLPMPSIKLDWKTLGLPQSKYSIRDLWLHKVIFENVESFLIPSLNLHQTKAYRLYQP